jgi:hypothetical protein
VGQPRAPPRETHVFDTMSRPLDQTFRVSSHGPRNSVALCTTKFEMMEYLNLLLENFSIPRNDS